MQSVSNLGFSTLPYVGINARSSKLDVAYVALRRSSP